MDYWPELKKTLEEQNDAFAKFKSNVFSRIDALENTEAKSRRPALAFDAEAKSLRRPGRGLDQSSAEVKEFGDFIRRGEQKAMSTGTGSDGGYAVPKLIDSYIQDRLIDISPMRQICRVVQVSTPDFHMLLNRRGTSSGWVGEAQPRTETNTPQLVDLAPPVGEIYANMPVSQRMLDDAFFNTEQWAAEQIAAEFDQKEGVAFISGDSINKPMGFLTGPAPVATADASRSADTLQYVPTGVSGAFPTLTSTVNPCDVLFTLVHSLKKGHRRGACWLMNKATLFTIMAFKDYQGRYVFSPATAPDMPASIMGYPVVEAEDMPDIAANAFAVAFGNFSAGYTIVDRIGTRMIRDPFSNKPNVNFYCTRRVGGSLTDREAIKLLKFSAT
jgi:HK97 family phage major capsid protein